MAEGISSWAELEHRIAALPSEQERGEVFEQLCQCFFLLDPVFQFDKVHRHHEIPPSLRERLGYPGTQDIGIDGLGITTDGKLIAYQAKFRSDRDNIPTLRELSTFFTVSDRADWRITITNANGLPSAINDRTNNSRVLADRFEQLEPDFFNRLRQYLKNKCVTPPSAKMPHQTQQEAINAALLHFKDNSRGQLILPCGTGKTLVAMWIAERLGSKRILVMVPSLSLMSQSLREWAANTALKPFRYLCLCSDTTVDLGNDAPVEHLYEMDVPVTTDVKTVAEYLGRDTSIATILFSTYQSSKVLSEATKRTDTAFDIAIFDEAHRTTGTKAGVWNIALDDEKVPVKHRLFMTATPRIYAPHITKKAKEEDVLICSMDDAAVYGKPFYEMTFGDAIARGHITDYKIVVICVTDTEVREMIRQGGRVITDDEHEWDAKAFAKRVALIKGINSYGLKKVFTFHSRVNGAKAFTDHKTPYGIQKVFVMISPHNNSKEIKAFHVNGTMPSGVRTGIMTEFKQSDIGIMSNARCLTEGVDVPAVDTVAFIDPKKSLIDIVQATGRAMRNAEWKNKGYIFIPVIVKEDDDPEQLIESSDFKTVWQVLQAMLDQDQRLEDVVSFLRTLQGKREEATQAWRDAMNEYAERVEFYNLPAKINQQRFVNTLYTKTLEVIGKTWDFCYGLTLKYKEQTGDANAPQEYKTLEGFYLGEWQSHQRANYKANQLSAIRIKRLDEIGFIWDKHEEFFNKGFHETLRYKSRVGNANAPLNYKTHEGFNLGRWQGTIRYTQRKGRLSAAKTEKLNEVGFVWDIYDEMFEKGFEETLKYKEQTNSVNTPKRYKTPDGFRLGIWQGRQRKFYKSGKLSLGRIKRLEAVGFIWSPLDDAFEKGFQETLRYKDQKGDSNAPPIYTTADGYKLGMWQSNKRQDYKHGKLDTE